MSLRGDTAGAATAGSLIVHDSTVMPAGANNSARVWTVPASPVIVLQEAAPATVTVGRPAAAQSAIRGCASGSLTSGSSSVSS